MTGEYNDDSRSILSEIGLHTDEDNDADDKAHDDDEELLEAEEQYCGDEEDRNYGFREIYICQVKMNGKKQQKRILSPITSAFDKSDKFNNSRF